MKTTQKTEQQNNPEWISGKHAVAMFCLGLSTIYKLSKAGQIATTCICQPGKSRGRRFYSVESIRALFAASTDGAK